MPSIAIVHGAAIGSGVEIAAACDFIIATPDATFSTPEAMWGTVGATQRLARVLGKRLAKDLMFTGRKLSAEEARTAGLVTRIDQRLMLGFGCLLNAVSLFMMTDLTPGMERKRSRTAANTVRPRVSSNPASVFSSRATNSRS